MREYLKDTEPTKIESLDDLKRIFLENKRRSLLENYVNGLRTAADEIKQYLNKRLGRSPVNLEFIVEKDKAGYCGNFSVSSRCFRNGSGANLRHQREGFNTARHSATWLV